MVENLDGGLLSMAAQIRPWLDGIDRVRQVLAGGKHQIEFGIPMIVVLGD